MSTILLTVIGILILIIAIVGINLATMSLNDFLEKTIKRFLWLWLPFHALKRLSKEFQKKYMQ
jgi:uncharacterized membrane protein YbaN (DUF454 family)